MPGTYGDIDEHIQRLRSGGTLTENEVKALCEKVSFLLEWFVVLQMILFVVLVMDLQMTIIYHGHGFVYDDACSLFQVSDLQLQTTNDSLALYIGSWTKYHKDLSRKKIYILFPKHHYPHHSISCIIMIRRKKSYKMSPTYNRCKHRSPSVVTFTDNFMT